MREHSFLILLALVASPKRAVSPAMLEHACQPKGTQGWKGSSITLKSWRRWKQFDFSLLFKSCSLHIVCSFSPLGKSCTVFICVTLQVHSEECAKVESSWGFCSLGLEKSLRAIACINLLEICKCNEQNMSVSSHFNHGRWGFKWRGEGVQSVAC